MPMILFFPSSPSAPPPVPITVHYAGNFIGLGVESIYGDGAPISIMLPSYRASFVDSRTASPVATIISALTPSDSFVEDMSFSGTIDLPMRSNGVSDLLISALGSKRIFSDSLSGIRTYVIEPAGLTGPSFQISTLIADTLLAARYGTLIDSLTISAAFNEMVSASISVVGTTSERVDVDPATEYPQYPLVDPLSFTGITISRNGLVVNSMKSFGLKINNNLNPLKIVRKNTLPSLYNRGAFSIEFSCVLDVVDTGEWDLLADGTEFYLSIELDGKSGESLTINIPRMRWSANGTDVLAGTSGAYSLSASVLAPVGQPPISLTLATSSF